MAITQTQIIETCVALFNAAPGATNLANLQAWADANPDATTNDLAVALGELNEFTSLYSGTNAEIASLMAANFGLTSGDGYDAAVAYFVQALEAGEGHASILQVANDFLLDSDADALAGFGLTDAAATLANKITVAEYYSVTKDQSGDTIADLQAAIANVDETSASVTAANEAIDDAADTVEIDGTTFALTSSDDTIEGTENNDAITAVTSSLSSEKTLDGTDVIDGAEGTDVLQVEMNSSHAGFSTGSVKNVENIELTNASAIARTFDMTGISGAESISIDATNAAVNLTDLADTSASISFANQESGTASIAFTSGNDILTDTTDELNVEVSSMGTADDADTTADETAAVTLTLNDIETVNLTARGTNVVDLDSNDAKTIVVDGSGSLEVATVGTGLTDFDGSSNAGGIEADLTATTSTLDTIKTGLGDDKVTIDVADAQSNAVVEGGSGSDTLVLTGTGTVQFVQTGFEAISLGALGGALTVSGTNTSDLETINVTSTLDNTASLVNLGSQDLAVNLVEDNSGNNAEVEADNSGSLSVTSSASSTATSDKTVEVNDTDITAANSTSFALSVGAYTKLTGDITVAKAETVTIEMASGLDENDNELTEVEGTTLTANTATAITVDATNGILDGVGFDSTSATSAQITTGETASDFDINAAAMTDLTITAGGDVTLNTGTTTGVEVFTVETAGTATITDNLAAVAQVNLSGTGDDAEVDLANLGSATLDYNMAITASGLKAGLDIGTIDSDSGTNITIDVDAVTGTVDIGNIGAGADQGNDVTISAMGTGGNMTVGTITEDRDVTINADVTGTLEVGEITAGDDVVVEINDTTGLIKLDAIDAENVTISAANSLEGLTDAAGAAAGDASIEVTVDATVTIDGSAIQNNDFDITLDDAATGGETEITATLNGGIGDDTFVITGGDNTEEVVVTGTGASLGTDTLTLDISNNAGQDTIVDASGVTGGLTTDITTVAGDDTITASVAGGTITAAAGNDALTLGAGDDVIVHLVTESTAASADGTTATIAAGDTLTFASGVDTITGFDTDNDTIDVAATTAAVTLIGEDKTDLTDGNLFVSGSWNASTKVFTFAADGTGDDTLLMFSEAATAASNAVATNASAIVLVGVDSDDLSAAVFV